MKAQHLTIAALVATCFVASGEAQNWPSFRGDNASGVALGAKPPVAWNVKEGTNIRFKTAIPGFSHACPVIWGDTVYLTTAVHAAGEPQLKTGLYGDVDTIKGEGEISWRLLALDKRTGKVLWDKEVHKGTALVDRHMKSAHDNSSPATDGQRVVVLFGSAGILAAFDMAGQEKWRVDVGGLDSGWFYDPSYQWGHASSPILWDGRVIIQVDRAKDAYLAAFDAESGKPLWKTARPGISSWGTPTVVASESGTEIVADGGKGIFGYDAKTGAELWKLEPTAPVTVATPVTGHGLVYVVNGYRPVQPVYAIKPGGRGNISPAEGATTSSHVVWSTLKGGTYIPTPIVVGDELFTLGNDGTLTCWKAKTGEQCFKQRVGGGRAAFTASPVSADGKLYLSSEDGDVTIVKAGPAYESLGLGSFGESIMATPAISGDTLYVRTRGHLVAVAETAPTTTPSP